MQAVIALWVFALGACIGSFLNVVIYRLPAQMSLSKPRSRCPRCETELAMRDNIPILGWILLRGRCRYCELPIAPRYPIIEATTGLIFLGLMFGELLRRGANMPHWEYDGREGRFWLDALLSWKITSLYVSHCTLLVVVLSVAMISWDRHQPVMRLAVFGAAAALVLGIAFPHIRSVHFVTASVLQQFADVLHLDSGTQIAIRLTGAADWIAGIAAGFIAGQLVLVQLVSDGQRRVSGLGVAEILLLIGAFLGWQAILLFLALLLPLLLVLNIVSRVTGQEGHRLAGPGTFFLLVGFLLAWKQFDSLAAQYCGELFPGYRSLGWLAVFTSFTLVARFLTRQPDTFQAATSESPVEQELHGQSSDSWTQKR